MKFLCFAFFAALLIAGCQAASRKQHDTSSTTPAAIAAFTDQKSVYECPSCKMDYDRAGKCPMCGVDLVAMKVDYICPADDKPVDRAGKCPRCAANARIEKTAMNAAAAGAPKGN
jgi:hypothetical protein